MVDLTIHINSKAVEKLIAAVRSGIGAIARPPLLILEAMAEGKAKRVRLIDAHELAKLRLQQKVELETLRALPPANAEGTPLLAEVVDAPRSLVERGQASRTYQDAKRQRNVDNVVMDAAQELAADPNPVSDTPVDDDWTARFFSHVQDVSNEDMQNLWGRILAGEVRHPGSFSVRTLDTVQNLERAEAELFTKALRFSYRDQAILHVPRLLDADGLIFGAFVSLANAGLLTTQLVSASYADARAAIPNDLTIPFTGSAIRIQLPEPKPALLLPINDPAYALTSAGIQLAQLFKVRTSPEVLKYLAERWAPTKATVTIFVELRSGQVTWDPTTPFPTD